MHRSAFQRGSERVRLRGPGSHGPIAPRSYRSVASEPNDDHNAALRFAQPRRGQSSFAHSSRTRRATAQIDLVVLGESSADGVPYDRWVSIGKIVAWKLQEAIPERPIQLNVIARSGDTLEKQHLILSNLDRRPDLLIIYCGHNEFYSRLWWCAITSITTQLDEASQLLERIGDKDRAIFVRLRLDPGNRRSMPDRDSAPVDTSREPGRRARSIRRSNTSCSSPTSTAGSTSWSPTPNKSGALPILILPPANDADFEPNRSFLPPSTSTDRARSPSHASFWPLASSKPSIQRPPVDRFRALLARQPCFAETHFRSGPAARASRRLGCSLSGIRGRTRSRRHADAVPELLPASLPRRGRSPRLHLDRRTILLPRDRPPRPAGR